MKIKYKQFVIIPLKPNMSTGKVASQTAHATFMALENQKKNIEAESDWIPTYGHEIIDNWKENGMCVIVLQCGNPIELMGIAKYLKQWRIPHHLYVDEGITEIPMGTPTALSTGVMCEEDFWMLSTMKLYGTAEKKANFFRRMLK